MNDAGRIGFLIKGDYDASTTYNFLDIVFYNGNSYVAKKDGITGITPTEKGENWQLFATGGEGQKIDVDEELNEQSTNPVQNKAIYTEITSLKKSVSDGKTLVAEAITNKGVQTATDAEFQTMADHIGSIKTDPTLQEKTDTLNVNKKSVVLTPDSGFDGLSKATVSITTQEKTATLATSQVVITPNSGKVLSKVTVPAVTGTAVVSDVLANKTFSSATGINKTGTMASYSKQTVDVASGGVNADADNTHSLVNVPKAGYYDTQSKLKVLNSDMTLPLSLLWKNTKTTTSIGAFTISAPNLSKYKKILLRAFYQSGNNNSLGIGIIDLEDARCDKTIALFVGEWVVARTLTINTAQEKITFSNGYIANPSNALQTGTPWELACIPESVYGINIDIP